MYKFRYILLRLKFWVLAYIIVLSFGFVYPIGLFFALLLFLGLPSLINNLLPFLPFDIARIIALPIQIAIIALCGFVAFKMRRIFYNFVDRDSKHRQKNQKSYEFNSDSNINLVSIKKLPTNKNIQKLIYEDGEIPDDALQNEQNSGN